MTAIDAIINLPITAPVVRLALLLDVPNKSKMDTTQPKPASEDQTELANLLAAVGLRDRQAFKQVYEMTSATLYGVALRVLDSEVWAQDVLQEAYIRIWNSASSYQPHLASPRTWMATIVRNQALDLLRKRRHEVRQSDPLEITEEINDGLLPAEKLSKTEDGRRLSNCLGDLKPEQRQTIALAYLKGFTHDQLSDYTGQPLGTVKTWIRRGLEQLRRCMES